VTSTVARGRPSGSRSRGRGHRRWHLDLSRACIHAPRAGPSPHRHTVEHRSTTVVPRL